LSSYRVLLAPPTVRWQVTSGLLAQVTQGAGAVAIILVVRQHTGSLTLAGGVVGALSIAAGLARPLQGRLIDRRGSRKVMAVCGVIHALALGAIVGLARVSGIGAWLVILGILAGLSLPPVSTSMRVEWAAEAGEDRTATYSLVYLTQELAILTGPLVLAGLIAAASASVALVTLAALAGIGSVAFALVSRSGAVGRIPEGVRRAGALRHQGMGWLLAVALLVGAVIGGLLVAVPTLATAHRSPAASGLLLALLSVGGIVGATGYGSRPWRASPMKRLLWLLGCLALALAVMVAVQGLWAVGAVLLLAGIPLNPAVTTFSLLVDQHVPARAAGEAFGWLSSALASGTGAASAVAAAVAQHHHDARRAFLVAAVAGVAAVAVALVGRTRLDRASRLAARSDVIRPGD
jgi:MFS family permease